MERGGSSSGEEEHCSPRKSQKVRAAGIDVLPDEALQHILSFLPSQEAVQTCVLARRWRHLWRSVPTLRLPISERVLCVSRGLTEQEFSTLNSFVTNFLLCRERDATLELCEFHINELEADADRFSPQVGIWIQHALLCKAQTLRFSYFNDMHFLIDQQLTSQHLMTLELYCVWVTSEFLDFSSCPALKKLLMKLCTIDAETISSESLQQLTIMKCFSGDNTEPPTRIVAPNLVQLELTDNRMKTPFLENMPALAKGFVRLHGSRDKYDDKSDGSTYSVLLQGLSEAESLELVAEPGTFIFKRDLMWCPIFGNLKTLLLNEWCIENGFQALLCFLQHTPVLKKLILQLCEAPMNWVGKKGKYNPSKQLLASRNLNWLKLSVKALIRGCRKSSAS